MRQATLRILDWTTDDNETVVRELGSLPEPKLREWLADELMELEEVIRGQSANRLFNAMAELYDCVGLLTVVARVHRGACDPDVHDVSAAVDRLFVEYCFKTDDEFVALYFYVSGLKKHCREHYVRH